MIVELTSLSQFNDLKKKPLLVIDFHAEWCGPCKQISPVFNALATKHASSRIVFAKCDVDRVRDVAQVCGITAMPTFQFFRSGQKLDEIKGASGPALTSKITQYAAGAKDTTSGTKLGAEATMQASPSVKQGVGSLREYINVERASMLNASSRSTIKSIVRPSFAGAAVDSASGPGLMLYLPFKDFKADLVHIKMTVKKEDLKHAPAKVHISPNIGAEPRDMMALARAETVQTFTLFTDDYDANGAATLTLKQAKFKGVLDIAILIEGNLGGDETVTKVGQVDLTGGRA